MNEMIVFNFNQSQVRTVIRNGEPWFVTKDVCDILELTNSTMAIEFLDTDERGSLRITEGTSPLGGNPNVNIISESGLYVLIFKSRKPEAKAFCKWVTSEVLPTIRKTGQYKAATANMTLNEFVSREFAALRSMAITAGLEGNAATVSANNAMVRIHSVSPLKLL